MLYWSLLTKIFSDILADAGVDITTIKRHAGWKSTTVAEGTSGAYSPFKEAIFSSIFKGARFSGGFRSHGRKYGKNEIKTCFP
ncbi:hypothetical protein NQ317_019446 [Molorchus minor]|uniref:Uncharacterized protein n=1 Tax=Molorchus minor TaxID=1323400 RepID=A0ABQ9JR80_9CUCU|nr:hypothetical protein NQ317_019446 [Molorchus minor]